MISHLSFKNFLALTLFLFFVGWLHAEEVTAPTNEKAPSLSQDNEPKVIDEEPALPKSKTKDKVERSPKKEKKKDSYVTIVDDEEKTTPTIDDQDIENYSLKNPELIDRYLSNRNRSYTAGEHLFANIFMGAFSGASFGALGSLVMYTSGDQAASEDNLIKFSGGGALAGVFAGALVTWFEYRHDEQFTIGPVLMNYTWYGAIGGSLAGMVAGLIPFSSSNDTADILNYTGYGALTGVGLGLVLFFVQLPENLNIAWQATPTDASLALAYKF